MKHSYLLTLSILYLLIFLYIEISFENTAYGNADNKIFKPLDSPYNKTFSEWAHEWWQWHLSIPDIKENKTLAHPRDNYSPEKCSWNQNSGPVWFLPDGKDRSDISTPEVRLCDIPSGKAILVQIVGSGCSKGEGLKNDQELLDCAVWVLPTAEFSASIDGIEVLNTKHNPGDRNEMYVQPYKTNLTYVDRNYYPVQAGSYEGMIAGYYLFIPPLSPGKHEIQFNESAVEFLNGFPSDKRLSNVKYIVTITPNIKT